MLMIGVTLVIGGAVTSAALGQESAALAAGSAGSAVAQANAGSGVSLAYATVGSTGGCPAYKGTSEGTTLVVSLFSYGTTAFTPAAVFVNSTIFAGSYPTLQPGNLVSYTLTLTGCAHQSGQTVLIEDAQGDEAQFET